MTEQQLFTNHKKTTMNILRKLNGLILLMLSGAILTTTIISCKKTDSGGGGNATPAPSITSFSPSSAASGATVTITGTNFTGATAVKFGGTAAASYTVVNATTITAVVGSGSSGDVSVTTPGGTATKAGFTFSTTSLGKIKDKINTDAELTQIKAIVAKGLLSDTFAKPGPFTVFAPVDATLTAYGLSASLLDQPTSELVVAYHTVAGRYLSTDIPTIVTPGSNGNYQNENIKVFTIKTPGNLPDSLFITKLPSGDIYVNGVSVDGAKKDILADNGVIHKLNNTNGFLFPSFDDAVDYINKSTANSTSATTKANGLDSLAKALAKAKQALPQLEQLLRTSVVSIMAPTNKAFQDFFASQPNFKKVDDLSAQQLLSLLSDHLVLGRKFIINIAFASSGQGGSTGVNTYSGVPLKFSSNPLALYLTPTAGADLVVPDIMILNGVVHKIGKILTK
ncbi:MAG: hypothetical protein FGM46_07280 [Ferruginibacter sp.]|nr:hypothetical protein [Ferruginibacter sp.]